VEDISDRDEDHLPSMTTVESTETSDPLQSLTSSGTSLAPPLSTNKRSTSPVGRFRDVFKSKKGSAGSPSPSPERRPVTAGAETAVERPATSKGVSPSHAHDTAVTPPRKPAPAERFRRLSKGQKIDTTTPPRTPPEIEKGTPVIVNTPPTPTDPRHSIDGASARASSPDPAAAAGYSDASSSTPKSMISQRRGRAGSASLVPSKLSNITLPALSPTPENGPTSPGGSFFSSMISAAQNATNTLSNTITNTNIAPWTNSPKKNVTPIKEQVEDDDQVEVEPSAAANPENSMDSIELAVKTLGMGDLSLSQLGIAEAPSTTTTPTASRFPDQSDARARSESAPVETSTPIDSQTVETLNSIRPQSLYEPSGQGGERTPPTGSVYEGKSGIQRSGSTRSAIGRRRTRGSSAATGGTSGTTIGAAIASMNAAVANPNAQSSVNKLTGFAIANKKRNRDFHALFKSVPDDDYLIEDYSCALQREILAHGRLYVSEGHLCFSSNILGWVTTLVMSFDEIVAVEKRSTALVFKNGLMISTLQAKHIFASFASRDSTYDLIVKIWKLGHPSLQSSLNGVRIDETGGDKTEKIDVDESVGSRSEDSPSDDESDDDEDMYDEDDDMEDVPEATQITDPGSLDVEGEKAVTRKPSATVGGGGGAPAEKPKEASGAAAGEDFPGPTAHSPTDCGDASSHFDKFLGDEIVPAPLGKVFSLMFGPMSVNFMSKWLANDQKCSDFHMEDQKGLGPDNRSRTYDYIKPLTGPIGPKQTKCIVTEHIENIDFEKAVNVMCTTQTPDVPSGNVFSTKTRYCLSWGDNNSTRIQANFTVEWTGKSWIKGVSADWPPRLIAMLIYH